MILYTFLQLVAAALALTAATRYGSHELHEKRDVLPGTWSKHRTLGDQEKVPIRIHLNQQNLEQGAARLMEISDPRSPDYGKHWTNAQVRAFFQPLQSSVDNVTAWLHDAGISSHRIIHVKSRGVLSFRATAAEANRLLSTEMNEYRDTRTGSTSVGCDQYSLPVSLRSHVHSVCPILSLPRRSSGRPAHQDRNKRDLHSTSYVHPLGLASAKSSLANCNTAVTPACIAALYRIPPSLGYAHPKNSLGIFEDVEDGMYYQGYDQTDLNTFFTLYTNIPNGTHPIADRINGGVVVAKNATQIGSEAELDYQVAYPIIYPQTITSFVQNNSYGVNIDGAIEGPDDPQNSNLYGAGLDPFFDAIDREYCEATGGDKAGLDCGLYAPTNVISFSYGNIEVIGPFTYEDRVCTEFMKLGLQGITILFASGDGGVGSSDSTYCGGSGSLAGDVFLPNSFSSCPWVTSVGGTQIPYNAAVNLTGRSSPEVVWEGPFSRSSGGGFSNHFPQPDYQKAAVKSYLADANVSIIPSYAILGNETDYKLLGNGTSGVFNRIGRAYPDVAALANNIVTQIAGYREPESGTSAATPLWAALITRINDVRLSLGKKPVGFINPVVYQHPEMFNDITSGSNPNCNSGGFPATKGWDAVTGMGSPIFPRLEAVFVALP